jgi:hypothetical protein
MGFAVLAGCAADERFEAPGEARGTAASPIESGVPSEARAGQKVIGDERRVEAVPEAERPTDGCALSVARPARGAGLLALVAVAAGSLG